MSERQKNTPAQVNSKRIFEFGAAHRSTRAQFKFYFIVYFSQTIAEQSNGSQIGTQNTMLTPIF